MIRRIAVLAAASVMTLGLTAPAGAQPRLAGPTQADQVIQWNQELIAAIQVAGAQPATVQPTRTFAIAQLAVYDAVSAIVGGHAPLLLRLLAPRSASPDAAAAAAAHTALVALLPSQQPALDAKFQDSLAQLGSGPHVRDGIRVGERAAWAVLAARANDGSDATPPAFVPQPGPGEYQLTRVPPPPAVTSAHYADDFNEVKALGELNSTTRSSEQADIGRFWSAAPVWIVWNQIAQTAAATFHNSLAANARMFAMLDLTLADGVIALYDSKYAYHRWRPITAVRAADDDGNPATAGDPTWTALSNTAPDPSYPGAHAEISQSAASALRDYFGTDRLDFSLTNASLPGVVRSFRSFSQAADEAAASRIYSGQHFRYDEDAGQALGDQVADFVAAH